MTGTTVAGTPLAGAGEQEDGRIDIARQYQRDAEEALQVAHDADVVYGDGTAGPARLLRDPYEVLAAHDQAAAAGDAADGEEAGGGG